jgi:hypothetical protein
VLELCPASSIILLPVSQGRLIELDYFVQRHAPPRVVPANLFQPGGNFAVQLPPLGLT